MMLQEGKNANRIRMNLTFHGAARNVTGSKHLLELNDGTQILLDCGMFQGMGEETEELNEYFGFDPKKVNHLILSHATSIIAD